MNLRYYRNFSVGTSTHVVQLYSNYTDEQGLADLVEEIESPRMADIIKAIRDRVTTDQISIAYRCMKDKVDVIVLENGKIGR